MMAIAPFSVRRPGTAGNYEQNYQNDRERNWCQSPFHVEGQFMIIIKYA